MVKTIALVWAQNLLGYLYIVSAIAALYEILHSCTEEEMRQKCEKIRQEMIEREGEEWMGHNFLLEMFTDKLNRETNKYWSAWRRKRMKIRRLILLTIVLRAAQLCLIGILAA